ncbi:MAG TPA: hypothetical protein VGE52_12125, partial [Pirellulales bacterium]
MASKTVEKQAPSKGQSWKPVNDTTASLRRARVLRIRRTIWTGVVVVLALTLFQMLLAPFYFDRPQIFCLAVSDYEMLGAPAPAFSREDFRALGSKPLSEVLYSESATERGFRELPAGQTAAALSHLKDQIQPALHGAGLLRNRDVLMVYLRVQGVSDNGVPYLLGSDFDPEFPNSGRVELRKVLEQVKACSARIKLFLLDAGDIVYAPRLGMIVNEFPRLLEREVAAIDDNSLWVLASHSSLERSHAIYPYRRSAFGYFTASGLAGAADIDGDQNVGLKELASYVIDRTSTWVGEYSGGADSQTPMLMWGGGRTTFTPSTTLVTVNPPDVSIPVPNAANIVPGAKPAGTGEAKPAGTGEPSGGASAAPEGTTAARSKIEKGATAGVEMSLAWLASGPVMWASYVQPNAAAYGPEPPRRFLAQAAAPGSATAGASASPAGTAAA